MQAREMALASVSTGVINSVIEKLVALLGEEYKKHKSMQREVGFLKEELRSINAALMELADMEQELKPQTKEWRSQVIDMAFDMEDCIDDFMHQVGERTSSGGVGFVGKIAQYITALRARHQFGNQVQQLKTRVNDVHSRRKRYKLNECVSISSYVAVDPRLPALYMDAANLVGLEGPKEELKKLLATEKGASIQPIRVVSIVGFGGLGKTTLANQVYQEIGGPYNCKVFVSVSQRPDMMKLLGRIITKVGMPEPIHTDEVQDLIDKIRDYLSDKRYLFVIDDIWEESVWEVICCAFPENLNGSKVITTTRINRVAKASCKYQDEFIYEMRCLDDQNSQKLFFSRFGQVCKHPFEQISGKILKRCGGLPLAIISIASLLVSQPTRPLEQWKHVCSSLSSDLTLNPTLEGMRQVLELSYNNLPHHLKACILYISMYPEDYSIPKEDLVRQWVAEGFIGKIHGSDAEEVAGSYFNELVNRSMLQPTTTGMNGQVERCKVHDMILDLIRLKSEEEKFLSVVENSQSMNIALKRKVRRLSFHFDGRGNEGMTTSGLSMSRIRSLAFFGKSPFKLPVSQLKSIRVLNLDLWRGNTNCITDLTPISRLVQLRYLRIFGNAQLPALIGELQCLETLELIGGLNPDVDTCPMPSDIVYLPCLFHLRIPMQTGLPDGICRMKALRTLQTFVVHLNSVDNIKGLSELTNLRLLDFDLVYGEHTVGQGGIIDVFWSSVGKLMNCNLRELTWRSFRLYPRVFELASPSTCQTGSNLEVLYTGRNWMSPRVPSWIGEHRKLYKLDIAVEKMTQEDVDLLAGLPNLLHLWLWIRESPKERIVIQDGVVAFQLLQYLSIWCFAPCLTFMEGAAPKLEDLALQIHQRGVERHGPSTLEGVEHLTSLRKLCVAIRFEGTKAETKASEAEAVLRNSINLLPGHPSIEIHLVNSITNTFNIFKDDSDGSDGGQEMERQLL